MVSLGPSVRTTADIGGAQCLSTTEFRCSVLQGHSGMAIPHPLEERHDSVSALAKET